MKRIVSNKPSPLFFIIIGLPLILLWLSNTESTESKRGHLNKTPTNFHSRESITFILGEDRELDNPYYKEAEIYYRYSYKDRTEHLVTSCRSMQEVREYLASFPPSNKRPWGLINLVTHGNQWIGLSVRLTPEGKRTSENSIHEASKLGLFSPMPDSIIDNFSCIYVHGCAVGKNIDLLRAVSNLFASTNYKPRVQASPLFEYYTSNQTHMGRVSSHRYYTRAWYAYYKKGYRPCDIHISNQLKKQYPKTRILWRDVLTREVPRWEGDTYHYTFDVPVKWVTLYSSWDDLPDISSIENQQQWIRQQADLMEAINKTKIPLDKFSWQFKKIRYPLDDGSLVPGIRVRGYCTVLCILQPLKH